MSDEPENVAEVPAEAEDTDLDNEPEALPHEVDAPVPEEPGDAEPKTEAVTEAKPEAPKEPEPPKSWKFKVNGEDKEIKHADLQKLVNEGDFYRRAETKWNEADQLIKKAEGIQQGAATQRQLIVQDPLGTAEQLIGQVLGADAAREYLALAAQRYLQPFWEEAQMTPEQRELKRIQREKLRLEREYQERLRRMETDRRTREEDDGKRATERAEVEFQNSVADELDKLGVPNDEYSLFLYERAREAAKGTGQQWTPSLAASIIKARRGAAPEAQAKPQGSESKKSPEEIEKERLKNLEKAREVRAAKLNQRVRAEGKAEEEAPRSQRSRERRQLVTIDDLRDKFAG